jgi:hypothetical protein
MHRGRAAIALNPTKFLNSKRRVIGMTANGKYAARTAKGGLVYNPKAKFVKSPGGSERTLANSAARVPTAIRAKAVRKVRANRGKARGVRAGVHAGNLMAPYYDPNVTKPQEGDISEIINLYGKRTKAYPITKDAGLQINGTITINGRPYVLVPKT